MKKTLGGDRLGSGKKMEVELHGYERSTHNMSKVWRSTMASGTLVPFLVEVGLPGDTFDIDLECEVRTHPTIGPLFGSFKVQLDVFMAPIRLYNGLLHNNMLGVGMKMSQVKLPAMELHMSKEYLRAAETDADNSQINPSMIFSYLGIRGVGAIDSAAPDVIYNRNFNAVPFVAYWDIYKNYYANKQETISNSAVGAVIHNQAAAVTASVTQIELQSTVGGVTALTTIDAYPTVSTPPAEVTSFNDSILSITHTIGQVPKPEEIVLRTQLGEFTVAQLFEFYTTVSATVVAYKYIKPTGNGPVYNPKYLIQNWQYIGNGSTTAVAPKVEMFPLEHIDVMREWLLQNSSLGTPAVINNLALAPYSWALDWVTYGTQTFSPYLWTQEGLAIKTYQSDLFNNWLRTDWIDGVGGISEITRIDTTAGYFTIDTYNLASKVYKLLNRVAVSGGTYDDWQDSVYTHTRYKVCSTPMYMGGLIKELVFQEVISNSESDSSPLGSLAGRGVMSQKHKGGKVRVKIDEPSYVIGIVSLTPRIDYSQGNKWDTHLENMDDLHKPQLDEIGFQELITEQMAWWETMFTTTPGTYIQWSAGKQPAWINYMTNVNETRGNFAIKYNEMYMTLNRRYEYDTATQRIVDLSTYIDPAKYNFIFAETALDAQNFWTQIGVDMTVRRKMSAKVMPNL